MNTNKPAPLKAPQEIIRGEEGLVEQLPEPTIAGTTVRKTFKTN